MRIHIVWALIATAGTPCVLASCPGDGTNSAVVAEYLLFEGSGSTALNTGTDGDAGNVTLTNGAAFHSDVPPPNLNCGWSVELTNATAAVETPIEYDALAGVTSFTIMAWVRRKSPSANSNTSARVVSDTSSLTLTSSTAGVEFRFSGSAGTLALRINGNELSTSSGGIAPDSNTWKHVAVVYDGTRPATNTLTRNVHFYVDGIQRGDGNTLTGVVVSANSNRLAIGNSSVSRGAANLLAGKVDDVMILRGFAPDAVGNGKTSDVIRCYMNQNDDIEPPGIACPANVTVNADTGFCTASNVALGEAGAWDNCTVASVENDAPALFPVGATWVVWTATDAAGNASSCTQTVVVLDTQAPTITCPPDVTVYAEPDEVTVTNINLGSPSVTDNCGVASVISIGPSEYPLGTTSVLWRVWDYSSNQNECEQQVTVLPADGTASISGTITL